MPERAIELITALPVEDCEKRLRSSIQQVRGVGSQIAGWRRAFQDATDLEYYEPDLSHMAAGSGPPDCAVGVSVPRLGLGSGNSTKIEMAVWDVTSHRKVRLVAQYNDTGPTHAESLLQRLQEVLYGVPANKAAPPPPPSPSDATTSAKVGPLPPSDRAPSLATSAEPDQPEASEAPVHPTDAVQGIPAEVPDDAVGRSTEEEPPMSEEDDGLNELRQAALAYLSSCETVADALEATLKVANDACSTRQAAARRPQHEISIANFSRVAGKLEQDFVPLYKSFRETYEAARAAAMRLRLMCGELDPPFDPELMLLSVADPGSYATSGAMFHVLRTEYATTPCAFLDGVRASNEATQADIFSYGEDGFQGQVWSPEGYEPPTQDSPDQASSITLATWEDIHRELLQFATSSPESIKLHLADPRFVSLTISESDGTRSQSVTVLHVDDKHGISWLRIESGFAQYSPEAANLALDYVADLDHSSVGVTKYSNDYLALRWSAQIGTIPVSQVFAMVDIVAGMADELEAKVSSGGDRF